jgi:hypothetical protein
MGFIGENLERTKGLKKISPSHMGLIFLYYGVSIGIRSG